MNESIIECRGLRKVFSSNVEELVVLRGIDLDVERGKRIAIMGPSGSGKSTFLSILGGLDRASSGSLRVGTFELSNLPERRLTEYRGAFVGFVFQFHYLLKDFTALENVAIPSYMRTGNKKQSIINARELLRDVGLGERLDHFPSQLSGGERQRAAMARALVNHPSLVLADEPTGNLDAISARGVREMLFNLSGKYGTTLVLVTHDANLATIAEKCYQLEDGMLRRS